MCIAYINKMGPYRPICAEYMWTDIYACFRMCSFHYYAKCCALHWIKGKCATSTSDDALRTRNKAKAAGRVPSYPIPSTRTMYIGLYVFKRKPIEYRAAQVAADDNGSGYQDDDVDDNVNVAVLLWRQIGRRVCLSPLLEIKSGLEKIGHFYRAKKNL